MSIVPHGFTIEYETPNGRVVEVEVHGNGSYSIHVEFVGAPDPDTALVRASEFARAAALAALPTREALRP